MTSKEWLHFAEQRGDLATVQALARAWASHPDCVSAEVLHSPAQASAGGELYLLVTRWQGEVPALDLPADMKGWAFAVLDPVQTAHPKGAQ